MRKLLISTVIISLLLLLITPQSFAECKGDFDCDGVVDGVDLADFAADFGSTDCPDCIVAPIPKTGQTIDYSTGDDGDLKMGVTWPDPRFTDNGDGTVTDKLTGLIWLKSAGCTAFFSGDVAGENFRTWVDALTAANSLSGGYCGLTDGSISGDWRLPNKRELDSLIDFSRWNPALPSGHPFIGVQSSYYWSSTTYAYYTDGAWFVGMGYGGVGNYYKGYDLYVWPVRGDN